MSAKGEFVFVKRKAGETMGNRKRTLLFIFLLSFFFFPLNKSIAAGPTVNEIRVADVTTRSFSAIWIAGEPSTANLLVYDAPACNVPVSGINVSSQGNDSTGVIKATVTGLAPATTYCFQTETTSKGTSEVTVSPATPQSVTTESQTTRTYLQNTSILPFGNDLIYHPVYTYLQSPGAGDILMAYINGGSYPLSAWVGDGMPTPDTLIDLNNLYALSARENMNLHGDERLRLVEVRGAGGCTLERWRKIPIDAELVSVKPPDPCFDKADLNCDNSVTILDVLRDVGGYNTATGDYCYNSDLDMNGNNRINILDILYVVGKYGTHR